MTWQRTGICTIVLMCLVLLGLAGVIQSEDGKRIMIALTTDTEGELNPCG